MRPPCRSRRRGTTLIEVLLGLVVLSTLLVSVAMARGRFLRQWADADHKLAQCRAADALLARWLAGPPAAVPLAGRGTTDGTAWQTRVVPSPAAATVQAVVVRLDVFAADHSPPVSVDFLVHDVRTTSTTRPVTR